MKNRKQFAVLLTLTLCLPAFFNAGAGKGGAVVDCPDEPAYFTCGNDTIERECVNIGTAKAVAVVENEPKIHKTGTRVCAKAKNCDDQDTDCAYKVPDGQIAE